MHWTFARSKIPNYFRVTTEGSMNVSDLEKMFLEIPVAAGWESGLPILFDNRQLDISGGYDEMRNASKVLERRIGLLGTGRVASLMDSPEDFGRSRQIVTMMNPEETTSVVHTFYDEKKAISWVIGPFC